MRKPCELRVDEDMMNPSQFFGEKLSCCRSLSHVAHDENLSESARRARADPAARAATGAASAPCTDRSHHRRRSADVYIDISPFYGMAPATVSGYRLGGRCYA